MSEYQYYEFLAIDKPLTSRQIEQVGAYSSRAQITATSFSNEYNWGDFRGDPKDFLRRFFDVMVYLANWGTRRLMFRVPVDMADATLLKKYAESDMVTIAKAGELLLIDILYRPDDGGGEWVETDGLMASLSPIRAEVMSGDFRALYIAWLHGLHQVEVDDNELEAPLPAGLRNLTAAQQALLDFLEVDSDLFEVAAAASPELSGGGADAQGLRQWLVGLPADEKDDLLLRLADGSDPLLGAKLRQRYQRQSTALTPQVETGRTVGQILKATQARSEERHLAEARREAAAKARREAQAAAERAEHLQRLSGRQPDAWRKVEALVEKRQLEAYRQAVVLLGDLREAVMASGGGGMAEFQRQFNAFRQTHQKKARLIGLMAKAGLVVK